MILSISTIYEALDDGRLILDPEPERSAREGSAFGTSAVDLRLGSVIARPREAPHVVVDLGRPGRISDTLDAFTDEFEMGDAGYLLEPGPQNLILGHTLETVRLPLAERLDRRAEGKPVLAARVEGKSSRARFGLLVHFTAPTIHAGWSGRITLEMMCLGPYPLRLYPGLPICQLIVEEVRGRPTAAASEFQGQRSPTGAS